MNAALAAKRALVDSGLVDDASIVGCSPDEVAAIEASFGCALPESYRTFLLMMGKRAGGFMVGSDLFYDRLPRQRELAERLLEEAGTPSRIAPTDFVFCSHQGYQFLFFDAVQGPDPPVFHFMEGGTAAVRVSDTFSGWLMSAIDDEVSASRALR